ncbi:MAG: MFS transporter [Thermoplasmataceae archaeon]
MRLKFHINVYHLAFSAFFADMGYQIVVGGLSIFIVIVLGAPVWVFAVIEAFSYGIGAFFAYTGGMLADRFGAKRIAIIGNSLIPVLSFTGLFRNYAAAGSMYITGWWSRNLRSPPRRTLLIESSTPQDRSKAFGFLHGLDVGGGIIASVLLITLYELGYPFSIIFFISIVPLIISTLLIVATKKTKRERVEESDKPTKEEKRTTTGIFIATALFGFSYYSIGFPILTAAQTTSSIVSGLLVYPIFMIFSALGGFVYSRMKIKREIKQLGIFGYALAGLGTIGIFLVLMLHLDLGAYYLAVAVLGLGMSSVETFEPAIISRIIRGTKAGTGMGKLSFSRSIGMFSGNIIVGLLYLISPEYSYLYAASVSIMAGVIVLVAGSSFSSRV